MLHFTTGRGEGSCPNLGEISKGRMGTHPGPGHAGSIGGEPMGHWVVSKQVVSGHLLPRQPAHPQLAFLLKPEMGLSLPGCLSKEKTLINTK